MTISINACENDTISLSIRDGDQILAQQDWRLKGNKKSELLLNKIDQFLRVHKIALASITSVYINPDIRSFTSHRIAQCVGNMLVWAIKHKTKA